MTGHEGLTNSELQERAARGWVWTTVSIATGLPVVVLTNVVVARNLGPGAYGRFSFYIALTAVLASVLNLGVQQAVVQRGAQSEAAGHNAATDDLLAKSVVFYLVLQGPLVGGALLLAVGHGSPIVSTMLIIGSMATSYFTPSAVALTAASRVDLQAKLSMVGVATVQLTAMTAAVVTDNPNYVFGARLVVGGALGASHLLFLSRSRRRAVLRPRWPSGLGREFWAFSLYSCLGSVVSLLVYSRSEIFVMRLDHQDVGLGVFSLGFGLASQITAPIDGLLGPLLPALSGIATRDAGATTLAVRRATRLSAAGSALVAVIAIPVVFALIPVLYGDTYSSAEWVFLALGLVSCLQTALQALIAAALARQRADVMLWTNVSALVVNAVLALTLIPRMGLKGAIIANVVAQICSLGLLARVMNGMIDLTFASISRDLGPVWVAGAAATAGCLISKAALGPGSTGHFLAAGVAVIAASALLAILARLFQVELPYRDSQILSESLPLWLRPSTRLALVVLGLVPRGAT